MPDGMIVRGAARSAVAIARDEVDAAAMQLQQAREWPKIVAAAEVGGQKLTRFSAEPIRSLSDALIKLEYAVKYSRGPRDRTNDALFAEVITYLRSQVAG